MKQLLIIQGWILLIGISSCNEPARTKQMLSVQEQISIATVRLTDLNNVPISMEQFKGKIVFISFWATWCKPCLAEMPSIEAAQDSLQNEKIVFLLASEETTAQIREFRDMHDYRLTYARIENMEDLEISALPATFIFNKKGDMIFSETGCRKWNERSNIDTLINFIKTND